MSDAAIRAALDNAAGAVAQELERQELSGDHDEEMADVWLAAAAITAFLREIGGRYLETMDGPMMSMRHLAAAVEEAARNG